MHIARNALREDPTVDDGKRTFRQACLWSGLILVAVVFYASMSLFYMNTDKETDTILYAKFLTSSDRN